MTSILLILVAMVVVFAAIDFSSFLIVANIRNGATDASVLLVLAVGMTFVIIAAGIDLSVGSVLVFSGVIAARLMNAVGGNGWGTILIGLAGALASGLAWGVLSGTLITRRGVPPLIVTFGTLGMAQAPRC